MTRLRAIHAIKRPHSSGLSDLVGYNDDGSPVVRRRSETIQPGAEFEIDDAHGERLTRLGAATADLSRFIPGVDHEQE